MENTNKFEHLTNQLRGCSISKHVNQSDADYRSIKIYPHPNEVQAQKQVYVRKNIVDGSYENVEHYLDTHFRLLREDFLGPLRTAICTYRENLKNNKQVNINEVRIFTRARFTRNSEAAEFSRSFRASFGNRLRRKTYKTLNPGCCSQKKAKNAKDNFMSGSLLCFSSDNFQTMFFGIVAKVHGTKRPFINVQLLEDVPFLYDQSYTMLECTNYFNPYYLVLKALQNFSTKNFPMEKFIINVLNEPEPPTYLTNSTKFIINDTQFLVLDFKTWPSKEKLNLNAMQYEAFRHALTSKFAIIQGPPGTGKTYLGLKIVQTLIENLRAKDVPFSGFGTNSGLFHLPRPILIVAGTNHALDQFLEGLIPHTKKIVRIGYQSKNDNVAPFTFKGSACDKTVLNDYYKRIEKVLNDREGLMKQLECVLSYSGIFDVKKFVVCCPEIQNSELYRWKNEQILFWLLGTSLTDARKSITEKFLHSGNLQFHSTHTENYILTIFDAVKQAKPLKDVNKEEYEQVQDTIAYLQSSLQRAEQHSNLYASKHIPIDNLLKLSDNDRWILYFHWLHCYIQHLKDALKSSSSRLYRLWEKLNEFRQQQDSYEISQAEIVGMTTSGAAKYRHLLENLKCPIMVVEEAAAVLESHTVISLTHHCEHLILIGDHLQLRPSTSDYQIEQEYRLGISLFERMVLNGICYSSLREQHRMQPEISRLIAPAIYAHLENHRSVYNFPNIEGIKHNVFFITHTHPEVKVGSSRQNLYEAAYVVALARHLILQGNDPNEITILTMYKSQEHKIKNYQRTDPFLLLHNIHVTSVDNFQGEENQIILLSLVRSNDRDNIGFLAVENRVCVALSRAKKGFYMVGNMDILSRNSKLWREIKEVLASNEQIGLGLQLTCQLHPVNVTVAKTSEDFLKVSDGGCYLPCNAELKCGHVCRRKCHVTDLNHEDYSCVEACQRILCMKTHQCQRECWENCGSCQFPIAKRLPCEHTQMVPCSMGVKDIRCEAPIIIALICGHNIDAKCWQKNVYTEANCQQQCSKEIRCGHVCLRKCHYLLDLKNLRKECECKQTCTKLKIGCKTNHKCNLICSEPCKPCHEDISIALPCGHLKIVPCRKSDQKYECTSCKIMKPCGHVCYGKYDPNNNTSCLVQVAKTFSQCGHRAMVNCSEELDKKACLVCRQNHLKGIKIQKKN